MDLLYANTRISSNSATIIVDATIFFLEYTYYKELDEKYMVKKIKRK